LWHTQFPYITNSCIFVLLVHDVSASLLPLSWLGSPSVLCFLFPILLLVLELQLASSVVPGYPLELGPGQYNFHQALPFPGKSHALTPVSMILCEWQFVTHSNTSLGMRLGIHWDTTTSDYPQL